MGGMGSLARHHEVLLSAYDKSNPNYLKLDKLIDKVLQIAQEGGVELRSDRKAYLEEVRKLWHRYTTTPPLTSHLTSPHLTPHLTSHLTSHHTNPLPPPPPPQFQ